jgi:Ca2+-binding EF-hand superfamily protein
MKPRKYYNLVVLPEMEETFAILGFDEAQAYRFFKYFIKIDKHCDGSVDLVELYAWLKVKRNKFSDRMFSMIDEDESGQLGFKEFCVGIWNFCTYGDEALCKFAFDLFDIDQGGTLDFDEIDALIRMMFNSDTADEFIMEQIRNQDANNDNQICLAEYLKVVRDHPEVMYPAFHVQEVVRKAMFGTKYWSKMVLKREKLFGDESAGSSMTALYDILEKKIKERQERKALEDEIQKKQEEQEAELVKSREAQEEEAGAGVKMDHIATLKSAESKEDRDEARGWADWQGCVEKLDQLLYSEELDVVRKARRRMWTILGAAKKKREVNWKAKEKVARANAQEVTSERLGIFERSYEGQMRILFEIKAALATKKKTPKWAAWLISSKKQKVEAEELVKKMLFQELLKDHEEELEREFLGRKEARDAHNEVISLDMIIRFGTNGQTWDRCYDPNYQKHFYKCYKSKKVQWVRPHICENCNMVIEMGDIKCFTCDTERSELNQRLYLEVQPQGLEGRAYKPASKVEDGFRHDHI